MRDYIKTETYSYSSTIQYLNWLRNDFKKYQSDNMKTVNYLVKEFEMKKAATAYKRSTTHKTGTIDPLKLHSYKPPSQIVHLRHDFLQESFLLYYLQFR